MDANKREIYNIISLLDLYFFRDILAPDILTKIAGNYFVCIEAGCSMNNDKRPSFFRVIQIDLLACFAAIFFVLSWIYYIYEAFFNKTHIFIILIVFFSLTIISLAVMIWRYKNILTFFEDGIEAKAIIEGVGFFRDRGEIGYFYTHQGNKYLSVNTIMKTKRTQMFDLGEEVDVFIDRNNPKRAIIRDLFL